MKIPYPIYWICPSSTDREIVIRSYAEEFDFDIEESKAESAVCPLCRIHISDHEKGVVLILKATKVFSFGVECARDLPKYLLCPKCGSPRRQRDFRFSKRALEIFEVEPCVRCSDCGTRYLEEEGSEEKIMAEEMHALARGGF